MSNITDIFDAWAPLVKDNKMDVIKAVASKLEDKDIVNISFTCCHPSHIEPVVHILGSVEGNTHFLMGYGNPEFKVKSYHYQVIDPSLSNEDARKLFEVVKNPAKFELWTAPPVGDEGDGEKEKRVKETLPIGALVYTLNTDTVSCKKVKFMAANELLPLSYLPFNNKTEDKKVPVKKALNTTKFDDNVYTLVKEKFPLPESLILLEYGIFGLVKSNSIEFYDYSGHSTGLSVYDKRYTNFDLTVNGNTHPSILLNFAEKFLNIDVDLLKSYSE